MIAVVVVVMVAILFLVVFVPVMFFFLWTFVLKDDGKDDSDDGTAEVAFPGDVLRYGECGYHAPDEASVKEHHDQGDDDEHPVAADESADDEKQVDAIDECAGTDVGGGRTPDVPGEEPAAEIGDEHDTVGQGGVAVVKCGGQYQEGHAVGQQMFPTPVKEGHGEYPNKTLGRVGDKPPPAQVNANDCLGHFDDPHQGNDQSRDGEAAKKLLSFVLLFH